MHGLEVLFACVRGGIAAAEAAAAEGGGGGPGRSEWTFLLVEGVYEGALRAGAYSRSHFSST